MKNQKFYDIDPATKQRLKESLPMVLARYFNLPVKHTDRKYMVCCPFHKEDTPSFEIDPKKGVYKCFGCNKGGDVFTLVAEMENLNLKDGPDFQKTAKIIADIAHITLHEKEYQNKKTHNSGNSNNQSVVTQSNDNSKLTPYHIPTELIEKGMSQVTETGIYRWLKDKLSPIFGIEKIEEVLKLYKVGASKYSAEGFKAVSFPLINADGNCIDCKIFHIDPNTGSRKTAPPVMSYKGKSFQTTFALATMKDPENPGKKMNLKRDKWAYFGEHLLKDSNPESEICIVESEKTAIICSLVYPDKIWIATGSMGYLKADRFPPLKNFHCRLFPDRDATDKWEAKAEELVSLGFDISIDTTVANTPGEEHDDLADLILRSLGISTSQNCCPVQGDKNKDSTNLYSDIEDTAIEHVSNEDMLNVNKSTAENSDSKSTNPGTEKADPINPESESQLSEIEIWDKENPEPKEQNSPEWNDWLVRRICRNLPSEE